MRVRLMLVLVAVVVLAVVVSQAGAQFSTGSFTARERSELRAVNDWYKRCVRDDVPNCLVPPPTTLVPPPTTVPPTTVPATTTTTRPTTTTTAPPATAMPTVSNTGPSGIDGTMSAAQFLSTGSCNRKRITEQVRVEQGQMLGRTFTIANCALDGGFYYVDYSNSSNIPTLNVTASSMRDWLMFSPMRVTADRLYVAEGGFWAPCADCAAQDHQANQTIRAMPVTVTNSMFDKSRPPDGTPYHSEALHVVGAGDGYRFTNVRFQQDGPWADATTGTIKFTGRNSTFSNVFFDWGGQPAGSYFTTYFEGVNVTINGCRVARGVAGYQFDTDGNGLPDIWSHGNGYTAPRLTNCRDWDTNAPVP